MWFKKTQDLELDAALDLGIAGRLPSCEHEDGRPPGNSGEAEEGSQGLIKRLLCARHTLGTTYTHTHARATVLSE